MLAKLQALKSWKEHGQFYLTCQKIWSFIGVTVHKDMRIRRLKTSTWKELAKTWKKKLWSSNTHAVEKNIGSWSQWLCSSLFVYIIFFSFIPYLTRRLLMCELIIQSHILIYPLQLSFFLYTQHNLSPVSVWDTTMDDTDAIFFHLHAKIWTITITS